MNWHAFTETTIQVAEAIMIAAFTTEVLARTITMTINEVRKSIQTLRKEDAN